MFIQPFRPLRGIKGAHQQTIAARFLRPASGVQYQRKRLELPDGDFLDLDFPIRHNYPENSPIVLLLHGLEGSSRSTYMIESCKLLAKLGIRAVGMNFRGCSGVPNRLPQSYHAGFTQDVDTVLRHLDKCFPHAPKGLIGFSLGGNLALKYAGEMGEQLSGRLFGIVAISPPFDLGMSGATMELGSGRIYLPRFLASLKGKVQAKADLLVNKVDLQQVYRAKSFWEFDQAMAGLYGFRDASDYYAQSSCRHFLPSICTPTLIIRSWDDPFFAPDIPEKLIRQNGCLQALFTQYGGHVAFVAGTFRQPQFWAEQTAAQFIYHQVNRG